MITAKFFVLMSVMFGLKGIIHAKTPQIEITPKYVVVKQGEQVTVLCRAGEPTQYCRITTPFDRVLILAPSRSPKEGYSYAGESLENGQCGFKIDNVQERNNGIHGCYMGLSDEASANMTIVVAQPPSSLPDLRVESITPGKIENIDKFQDNDILRAVCVVRNSRPAANITWFLDGTQIFEGLSPIVHEPSGCNEEGSLCTSNQNLTRSVTWADNGKQLACAMDHFAQDIGSLNQTIFQLNVQYKPRDDETVTEQLSFEIGKPGMITKHVSANPKPTFKWNIGEGVWLNEGEKSARYSADEAVNNGRGAWSATLHISSWTANDVNKIYQLRTTNTIGSTDFQVSVSTTNTSTGVSFGAGAIVGIVISILVILIIIFLTLFARRSGRWCFSHPGSVYTNKTDVIVPGNNHYEQMKKPRINLCDIFTKDKDKIADGSEDLKDKSTMAHPLSPEVKQGHDVVYAELDLQQATKPPVMHRADDKTEYAEIIHTKETV